MLPRFRSRWALPFCGALLGALVVPCTPGCHASQTATSQETSVSAGDNHMGNGDDAGKMTFPLRAATNGRHLVDQNGVPFRMQGVAAWRFIPDLTPGRRGTSPLDRETRGVSNPRA